MPKYPEYEVARSRAFMYLGGKCLDCGTDDRRVLQFDHVPERGEKFFCIASKVCMEWGLLKPELDKCDLVCANCHAIRGYQRRLDKRS